MTFRAHHPLVRYPPLWLHRLTDLPGRRQDANESKRATADHLLAVYEHRELPVVPLNALNIDAKVALECARHTGGVNAGDSIAATADGHWHGPLQLTSND